MTTRFDFESSLYDTLEFMPLALRYRLDLAGLKLSLAAWQALTRDERDALCEHPVSVAEALDGFARRVERDAVSVGHPVTHIEAASIAHPWKRDDLRDHVAERALSLGVTVDAARFASLDDPQRYALHRLSAPVKDATKFLAALSEFGLT